MKCRHMQCHQCEDATAEQLRKERNEAQAENAAWRKATGYSDPEALDFYLGRAGIDAHLRVWTEMLEKRAAEVERLRDTVESLEEDFARRQAAHRCATWDDGQGTCECNNLARTVAERQREASLRSVFFQLKAALGAGAHQKALEEVIDAERAAPLVTEGGK